MINSKLLFAATLAVALISSLAVAGGATARVAQADAVVSATFAGSPASATALPATARES
jgi:hypothetical protein